jgi:hypothetical protein
MEIGFDRVSLGSVATDAVGPGRRVVVVTSVEVDAATGG